MGGSPDPPKPTDEQQKAERLQRSLMEEQLKQAQTTALKLPKLKPIPPPPPPATASSADVFAASEEERRRAAKRTNTAKGTLFAGETGGYRSSLGGQKTLLGGY
jgi:hypothetical protein